MIFIIITIISERQIDLRQLWRVTDSDDDRNEHSTEIGRIFQEIIALEIGALFNVYTHTRARAQPSADVTVREVGSGTERSGRAQTSVLRRKVDHWPRLRTHKN